MIDVIVIVVVTVVVITIADARSSEWMSKTRYCIREYALLPFTCSGCSPTYIHIHMNIRVKRLKMVTRLKPPELEVGFEIQDHDVSHAANF